MQRDHEDEDVQLMEHLSHVLGSEETLDEDEIKQELNDLFSTLKEAREEERLEDRIDKLFSFSSSTLTRRPVLQLMRNRERELQLSHFRKKLQFSSKMKAFCTRLIIQSMATVKNLLNQAKIN